MEIMSDSVKNSFVCARNPPLKPPFLPTIRLCQITIFWSSQISTKGLHERFSLFSQCAAYVKRLYIYIYLYY